MLIPPHSIESEMSLLGAIMIDNDSINKVLEVLKPEDFYKRANKQIFETMIKMNNNKQPIDLITLSEQLNSDGIDAGGVHYLTELEKLCFSSTNIISHAEIIYKKSLLRKIMKDVYKVLDMIQDNEEPGSIYEYMGSASVDFIRDHKEHIFLECLHELTEEIDLRKSGKKWGIRSGLFEVDRLVGRFEGGDLIVIAGYPSQGKTSLMNHIILDTAFNHKNSAVLFELEMSRKKIAARLLCMFGKINTFHFLKGELSGEEWKKANMAYRQLQSIPLVIDDTQGISVEYIKAKTKRLKQTHKIESVFIDYLQLMNTPADLTSEEAISHIVKNLKGLAKELDIPVILVSQFSRHEGSRMNRRPSMFDLKGSGAIEQVTDKVIMPWRKGMDETVVIVAKHRDGPTGDVPIKFIGEWMDFE